MSTLNREKEIQRRIHARRAKMGQGKHVCHWPTCAYIVPPAMWGCKKHWFKLPKPIRDRIWETYVPGQEVRRDPSKEYLEAAATAQAWIKAEIAAGREE